MHRKYVFVCMGAFMKRLVTFSFGPLSSVVMRTTKAQTGLCICSVLLAPLLFAYWKVSYLDMVRVKFQFSN